MVGGKSIKRVNCFEPTLIADVTADMDVATQETFGPLAAVFKFENEQQAVEMANATEFGLAAYCYTKDLGRAWRMSEQLEYGMVGINKGLISNEVAPLVALNSLVWGVKVLNTVLKIIWKLNTPCLED